MGALMLTLALDVDGVLLDPDRNGHGHWTNELKAQFGIERAQLRESFFMKSWDDVINGRRTVEDGLGEALERIGTTVDVESVLSCWFDADYAPIDETFDLARRAAAGAESCWQPIRSTDVPPTSIGESERRFHLNVSSTPPTSAIKSTMPGFSRPHLISSA